MFKYLCDHCGKEIGIETNKVHAEIHTKEDRWEFEGIINLDLCDECGKVAKVWLKEFGNF